MNESPITSHVIGLELYGTTGPLTINTDKSYIGPAWFQAAVELNYNVIDPNGNQTEGIIMNESTTW